jgi:hypothetical protein
MTMRELSDGKRIAMLLCDQAPHAAMPTAAIRLWVE